MALRVTSQLPLTYLAATGCPQLLEIDDHFARRITAGLHDDMVRALGVIRVVASVDPRVAVDATVAGDLLGAGVAASTVFTNLGGGNDSFSAVGANVDQGVFGDAGDDTLVGGDLGDYLDGGADDDQLTGGLGDDTIYGGTGIDTGSKFRAD
jgi:Ca2+-binding RTX toxin-like protein